MRWYEQALQQTFFAFETIYGGLELSFKSENILCIMYALVRNGLSSETQHGDEMYGEERRRADERDEY